MASHFTAVARSYNSLRTTDLAPVDAIAACLADQPVRTCADIGCGSGRYDLLLLRALSGLKVICCDINVAMLEEAGKYLKGHGESRFSLRHADAESLPALGEPLDFVACFNAIHHFDPVAFLRCASAQLRPGGYVFIYTRLREQNSETIWGRHFPDFLAREDRLYPLAELRRLAGSRPELQLQQIKLFHHDRVASLDRLIQLATRRHYSTFALYSDRELRQAIEAFRARILAAYPEPKAVRWREGNAMVVLRSRKAEKATSHP